jgi:hypothetical protein
VNVACPVHPFLILSSWYHLVGVQTTELLTDQLCPSTCYFFSVLLTALLNEPEVNNLKINSLHVEQHYISVALWLCICHV